MSLLDLEFLEETEERAFHSYRSFLADNLWTCYHASRERDFSSYFCTRVKGHSGKHAAVDVNGGLIRTWENIPLSLDLAKLAAPEFFT